MIFLPSEGTVGVEYELQLVDASTLDLVDGIMPVLEQVAGDKLIKPEFVQSIVEVITPICSDIDSVQCSLRRSLSKLRTACEQRGIRLCGAGTHPFCRRLANITPHPRYQTAAARTGILGHHQITQSIQVHVGVGSTEDAITALRELHGCLPMLLALSANSPFWHGYDTGYASWRHRLLASGPNWGLPPRFENWEEVEAFFEAGQRAKVFQTWRDIHWDLRPRPDFGTIEVRVMDSLPTVREVVGVAAFVRALTVYLIRTPPSRRPRRLPRPLPLWLERENHFQASRCALDARYIADPKGSTTYVLRDVLETAMESVQPIAEEFGDGAHLGTLYDTVLSRPSYQRQREVERRTASRVAVVRSLIRELNADLRGTDDARQVTALPP